MEEVRTVDAIDADKSTKMFSLEFERVIRWQAEDAEERNDFLASDIDDSSTSFFFWV